MSCVSGRNDIFVFLAGEDVNCGKIAFRVSVLSCLRDGYIADLRYVVRKFGENVSSGGD